MSSSDCRIRAAEDRRREAVDERTPEDRRRPRAIIIQFESGSRSITSNEKQEKGIVRSYDDV